MWAEAWLLLALVAAMAHGERVAPTTITLKAAAQVSAAVVSLGDVAEVAPAEAAAALAGLDLGAAPAPGVERVLTAGYVKVRLRHAGVNLQATVFQGERTVVRRLSEAVPEGPGAVAGRPVQPGIRTAADVKPGTRVRLMVRVGGLQIVTEAEALGACTIGQEGLFRVRETRATVRARLLDQESAEVTR